MSTQPDMVKVRAALERYGARRPSCTMDYRTYPPPKSPVAQDAAIRKPLTSHGNPCVGFNCSHFLNRDPS